MRRDKNTSVHALLVGIGGLCILFFGAISLSSSIVDAGQQVELTKARFEAVIPERPVRNSPDSSLVGYWQMDENAWADDCATSAVTDSSGNHNNGKACPSGSGPIGGNIGKYGKAGSFDGVNDFVEIPYTSSLAISSTGTIAVWIKLNTVSLGEQVIFGQAFNDGGASGIELELGNVLCGGSSAKVCFNMDAKSVALQGATQLVSGIWYHIAAVWDDTGSKIYVNGNLDASNASIVSPTNNTYSRTIGARQTDTSPQGQFNGLVDELHLYNRALSAGEILQIYTSDPLFFGTPMAYLPLAMVPLRTPTPTATATPAPSPTPIVFPGIAGRVTLNGSGIGGIPLELRFYNGSSFSTRATAVTSSNGSFDFTGQPSLGFNQRYYVRYRNTTDSTRLGYWATKLLTSYSAGTLVFIGDFDIQDIVLLNPASGANITFPYLFQWVKRTSTTSDNYQIAFYDPTDGSPAVWTPNLGYVSEANIPPLPAGFNPGETYVWEMWANEPDTAFGISFTARAFTFSASTAQSTSASGFGAFANGGTDLRLRDMGARP